MTVDLPTRDGAAPEPSPSPVAPARDPAAHMPASLPAFTRYQMFVVAVLAFLQFTIILDFMIISPLGATIMPTLDISPRQFGEIVSAYAFSAGLSGLIAAGFADRFDRKRFLLFFYGGFILGTGLCAVAWSYHLLLAARIVTGVFGGVIGSVVLAIATDLFALEMRGRVMGFVQTAFSASQVLGIPAGLYLANMWDWHAAFFAIVLVTLPVGVIIVLFMRPVANHLAVGPERDPWRHLSATVLEPRFWLAFATTALLATGGFVLMPFGSLYTVNNLGIALTDLPTVYLVSGLFTVFTGPLIGRATDRVGKFRTFVFGSVVSIIMVLIYTHLPRVSLTTIIIISVLMFVGIFSRMIPSQALMTAIPDIGRRGSFNAISSSLQQISGGIASVLAGLVVVQGADGQLQRFEWLGYIVVATTLVSLVLMYAINKRVADPRAA